MRRCLELASGGAGRVAPNPMVGAVIVHNDKIIGEGFHMQYGMPHAEVNAIRSVENKSILKESTLYVNLEPCAHIGKTPPCSDLIVAEGIPKVVIGTTDPNSIVAGKGIKKLKDNKVEVIEGLLVEECRELNRRFFTFHKEKRPYIILKWAQSADGYMDIQRQPGEPIGINWISNPVSRTLVHRWRAEEQAIMVGTETVLTDDPELNVRFWPGSSPLRVIPDRNLRIPRSFKIYRGPSPTLIFNEKKVEKNGHIEFIKIDFDNHSIQQILYELSRREKISLMVEGGFKILESFIKLNLWDEARVFIGAKTFSDGLKAPLIDQPVSKSENILNDKLVIYRNGEHVNSVKKQQPIIGHK